MAGFNGQISSINAAGSSFILSPPELENTRTISISSTGGTVFQGISNFSGLAVGTFVNMDGAIQPDGSLVASRIAVEDAAATSVVTGPVVSVSNAVPALNSLGRQEQGALFDGNYVLGAGAFSFGNAAFKISGQFSNLQDLPFIPSFTASNMVPGQNVYLSTTALTVLGGFPYVPLTSITLIPQTIDGTVSGTFNSGNFTVYTVELASYDLFPMLAVQPGQANLLNNPSEVQVYVDSNTQPLNSQPLSSGSTFRFYGLVFNDNGTLRMDCAEVYDGVSLTPQVMASQANRLVKGQAKILRTTNLGAFQRVDRLITPGQ